jgi:hypothetical protein
VTGADVYPFTVYFSPRLPLSALAGLPHRRWGWPVPADFPPGSLAIESAKWCIVLAIAMWLSVAQLLAWRRGSSPSKTNVPVQNLRGKAG